MSGPARHRSRNRLHRLPLGSVTLPDFHPRAADGECLIFGFAIDGPDGVVVIDTGPREGHPLIDELYAPSVVSIVDALHAVGLDERDVLAVVNSHLHFDHCGQNHLLPHAPVWVARSELEAAEQPGFTVPEWAAVDDRRLRISGDNDEVRGRVTVLHTPGHTPGHQSVAVQTARGLELIAAQACYSCGDFAAGRVAASDMHDHEWLIVGAESLERLRQLDPDVVHFSHDIESLTAG